MHISLFVMVYVSRKMPRKKEIKCQGLCKDHRPFCLWIPHACNSWRQRYMFFFVWNIARRRPWDLFYCEYWNKWGRVHPAGAAMAGLGVIGEKRSIGYWYAPFQVQRMNALNTMNILKNEQASTMRPRMIMEERTSWHRRIKKQRRFERLTTLLILF